MDLQENSDSSEESLKTSSFDILRRDDIVGTFQATPNNHRCPNGYLEALASSLKSQPNPAALDQILQSLQLPEYDPNENYFEQYW